MEVSDAGVKQVVDSPTLPAYGDGGLSGIVPDLLGYGSGWTGASRAPTVLLVIDGLGWNQLQARKALTPTMSAMNAQCVTSIAPTTTAAGLTSITTGASPSEHGLLGYRMELGGGVMNVLRWHDRQGDLRASQPPAQVQPCPPFMGTKIPVISRSEFAETGFTIAHLRGTTQIGWRKISSIAVHVGEQLRQGQEFVYAYYDGVDSVAHEKGFGDFYDAELRTADRLVADIISVLPAGARLFVTADHGQVTVGEAVVSLDDDVLNLVRAQSGEGRFRWLHAKQGTADALLAAAQRYGDRAWVVSREQVVDEGWMGKNMPSIHQARLGDVALVARTNVTFDDPEENGPFRLVCRHGSLTPDEMLVPLLSATA